LLNNGRVLIVGGNNGLSAAELYDPSSSLFTPTGQTIQPHGFVPTATLLKDGRVLVIGGLATTGAASSIAAENVNAGAETYDPNTGTLAEAGTMITNRNNQTATLLPDGRVLVAGGAQGVENAIIFDTAEIYNPSTGAFAVTGSMEAGRQHHFAVLLSSGKVLVGGGFGGQSSAELFDPASGTFASTGSMSSTSRASSTATLSPSAIELVCAAAMVPDAGVKENQLGDAEATVLNDSGVEVRFEIEND